MKAFVNPKSKTPPKFHAESVRSTVHAKVAKAAAKGVKVSTIHEMEGGAAALAYLKRAGAVVVKDEA